MSNVLSSAVNRSQQHQEENSWERLESNLGLLGKKQECHLKCDAHKIPKEHSSWNAMLDILMVRKSGVPCFELWAAGYEDQT